MVGLNFLQTYENQLSSGFLNLGLDILDWIMLSCQNAGLSIPRCLAVSFGLYPLDDSGTHANHEIKNVSRLCPMGEGEVSG